MRKVRCECGALYERTEEKYPSPGAGNHDCAFCERQLESWNGCVVPFYRLVKIPDPPPRG